MQAALDTAAPATDATSNSSSEELRKLRLAVEASGEVVFMTDAGGTITYVNPEFERVYGYNASELVGKTTPRVLKSGATSEDQYAAMWAQLGEHRIVKGEFLNRRKDGTLVRIESSANPIVMNGGLVGFLAVQRDITTRQAAEAAQRESEARYRALAEAAHDSIFIIDINGRIEYANTVSLERFRISRAAIGGRVCDVFPADTAREMWAAASSVFFNGERHYFENCLETPAGALWLGTWLVPLSRTAFDIPAVMGVARDITDRKRLEREFAQAQKMETVGRLAGGVAHDFNNLLTAILGYTDLVLDSVGHDASVAADLHEIRNAGERASRLTRQLLAFSRKQTFAPQALNVNDVVQELQKMLNRVIGEDLALEVDLDPELRPTTADPGQLEQVTMNLVVNARDAMPGGGTIRIRTANAELDRTFCQRHEGVSPGRYVALAVADTGCGIPADVLPHIFEPFFTTKPAGKGTGLGLSTVYAIVKESGGCITVDSRLGHGTTITVYLPTGSRPSQSVTAARPTSQAGSGSETVLLVEDEAALRRLLQRTLERYGYTVLNAPTADAALAIAEQHPGPIDLLVSDVIMPGLSGPDLAQRVVRLRPSIKVLYVSGYPNRAIERPGPLNRSARFLCKPFAPHLLAATVRDCLDSATGGAEGRTQ